MTIDRAGVPTVEFVAWGSTVAGIEARAEIMAAQAFGTRTGDGLDVVVRVGTARPALTDGEGTVVRWEADCFASCNPFWDDA